MSSVLNVHVYIIFAELSGNVLLFYTTIITLNKYLYLCVCSPNPAEATPLELGLLHKTSYSEQRLCYGEVTDKKVRIYSFPCVHRLSVTHLHFWIFGYSDTCGLMQQNISTGKCVGMFTCGWRKDVLLWRADGSRKLQDQAGDRSVVKRPKGVGWALCWISDQVLPALLRQKLSYVIRVIDFFVSSIRLQASLRIGLDNLSSNHFLCRISE